MFLQPLGLLALLAVPAVVALHLYRRRYRPRTVSAVFLWSSEDRTPAAGRRREPLRRSPSFWCELLAALCLALALAGPRACGAVEARHLVAVLDGSASMDALDALAGTRTSDRVRAELADAVRDLPSGSLVTLVASGPEPTVLAGPRALPEEALARLEAWTPGHARHDLAPAIALGTQLAAGGALDLWTDRLEPEAWPAEVGLHARGRAVGNVGFTHASRTRTRSADGEGRVEAVELVLRSFDPRARALTVELFACPVGPDGRPGDAEAVPLASRRFELASGADLPLRFELPLDAPPVRAEVRADGRRSGDADGLAVDDRAYLAPDPARRLRVCAPLDEATAARLGVERWTDLVPELERVDDPARAHLCVSRELPAGDAWTLLFPTAVVDDPDALTHLVGPFLVDRVHPLLEGVTLDGVVWSATRRDADAGPPEGAPLVAAGNRPLLVERFEGARRVFEADLEPLRSNLFRTPDWPVMLFNLCDLARGALPGLERTSLAVGDPVRYVSAAPARYSLDGGFDDEDPLEYSARDVLEAHGATRPGWYRLEQQRGEAAPRPVGWVGLSFQDPAESDLSGAGTGDRPSELALGDVRAERSWEELLLLCLALGLFGLDGWVLRGGRAAAAPGATGATRTPGTRGGAPWA